MTNLLKSILKSRDITLPTKVFLVKATVFLVVRYRCESCTQKVECWRIDAFELWYWRRLLRVPWTARRSISPEYSLEGLMLKLKLQYFGHLMWRTDSFENILMLGKTEAGGKGDGRGWDGWMASLTQWTWVWVNSGNWWWTGMPCMLQSMGLQRVGHDWATEQQQMYSSISWTWVVALQCLSSLQSYPWFLLQKHQHALAEPLLWRPYKRSEYITESVTSHLLFQECIWGPGSFSPKCL